jgi:hypothetical protein
MPKIEKPKLQLKFHGRIIDQLGIQMYQSPVAALAELIANSWDGDAELVEITLPETLGEDSSIIIKDNGIGMTLEDCQDKYLNIGYNRRGNTPDAKTSKGRPVLGRKGIGKFAGFGIARKVHVETISQLTGERTVFELDINKLRGDGSYIEQNLDIEVDEYDRPDKTKLTSHGTTINLHGLEILRAPSCDSFIKSMARRFLLLQRSDDFKINVNGKELVESNDLEGIEYDFPLAYRSDEKPDKLDIESDGWGIEELNNGCKIKWRIVFYRDTIKEEELRGIAVFARGKLAQSPFFFNITGGISGQNALEYMSGRIEADYLDIMANDVISTERQRVNWVVDETESLLFWGQERVKYLASLWKARRGEEKAKIINDRTSQFAERLSILPPSEKKVIEKAITKIASIESLNIIQFKELADAMLTAWEQGRLKEFITQISESAEMTETDLVKVLIEADVLTALNIAEVVFTRIGLIDGLRRRIEQHELETAVRDYISENPWLISNEWATYVKEESLKKIIDKIYAEHPIEIDEIPQDLKRKRIDLILRSGQELVIIEFMRPGKRIDIDHLQRFEIYVMALRTYFEANNALNIRRVKGLLVADELEQNPIIMQKLESLKENEMFAYDWNGLLSQAEIKWQEFFDAIKNRTPRDPRIDQLVRDQAI